jgi:predicted SAM-dependent methyltransferase
MKPESGWLNKWRSLFGGKPVSGLLLNLGCGRHFHPDWTNVDYSAAGPGVLKHDLRAPLPFPDGSCAVVYHSHVLEHFPKRFAPQFLRECHRALEPGGILRVVVPDLETIARLYLKALEGALSGDAGAAHRHEWLTLEMLDQLVRDQSGGEMLRYWKRNPIPAESFVIERLGKEAGDIIQQLRAHPPAPEPAAAPCRAPEEIIAFRETGEIHQWMYDRFSLARLLTETGFLDPQVCAADQSRIPNFVAYGLDTNPDGTVRKPDSLFMEAAKPRTSG